MVNKVEIIKEDNMHYVFSKEYINGDGKPHKCGLILSYDEQTNKADITQSGMYDKDTSINRLPLWEAISDLIKNAVQYADVELGSNLKKHG